MTSRTYLFWVFFIGVVANTINPVWAEKAPPSKTCRNITVFVTTTCPHCLAAREHLGDLEAKDPDLVFTILEVNRDPQAKEKFIDFNREHEIERPGVPTFSICGQTVIGFEPQRIEDAIYKAGPTEGERAAVELPFFGEIELADVGLPLFTVVLGLLDGFNPCAMWVLLFLLSVLVHVKSRRRVFLIASTFVLVSGLVYFALWQPG